MIEEVKIPEISENVESGTIIQVLVEVGDMIDIDDVLVEFETEKALVEIPSTVKGKITELLAKKGDEMRVGDVIARVDTETRADDKDTAESEPADDAPKKEAEAPKEPPRAETPEEVKAEVDETEQDAAQAPEKPAVAPEPAVAQKKTEDRSADRGPAPATPSVRRFARELGVDIYDVTASGPGGRITEDDVKAHIKKGERPDKIAPPGTVATEMTAEPELPDFSRWGEVEVLELDGVRRITAANMSIAWRSVPHVTQFDQADITGLQEFITKNAEKVAQNGGKLTVTAILVKVCAAALKKFGRFNPKFPFLKSTNIL